MLNKIFVLLIATVLIVSEGNGQNCSFSLKGNIFDETLEMPLSFVNISIQETAKGTISDEKGHFSLENICPGEYHLLFSHIGCEAKKIHVEFTGDTTLMVSMPHTSTSLNSVVIKKKNEEHGDHAKISISRQNIEDNANQNLSGLLENETGVHLIKNGNGIAKPVVHGLYGNRLSILNNGIVQNGQQWGNDHSPEIDPFAADKVVILKGANALEYAGGNLGSVILVEPKRIEREPHLHGQLNYVHESNGKGHTLNARLEKYSPVLAWRVNGTLKKYGDRNTPDYFLNNTGLTEANLSIQLEKSWQNKLFLELYGSTFNTTLGILRGSHIGNLTDLELALANTVPFFTEPDFSYAIDAPKQEVTHNLLKTKAKYYVNDTDILELILATQLNDRKEFDIRRSGRTDTPALSLLQLTTNLDLKYSTKFGDYWSFKVGNQNVITDNTNNPETGILPLIPDYVSWKSGLFSTLSKSKDKVNLNFGVRYDYEQQNVVAISSSLPREIIKYDNYFHNLGGVAGIKYKVSKNQFISFNSGYAMRNPAVNELYSNGLHQGVSGIEVGDISLKTEKALKSTLEYEWSPNTKFSFSGLAYHQYFKDYIFLNPQDEIRLTIRGAFPVFKYEQTDATIYGLDLSTKFTLRNSIFGVLKYSYLKGTDVENDIPLVFMAPNSLYASLTYRFNSNVELAKSIIMEDSEIEFNNRLVLEQKNLLPGQDFVAPPETYSLMGMKLSTNLIFANRKIRFYIKGDNLFNVRYRDYLNRQRYFADESGRSVLLGLNYKF